MFSKDNVTSLAPNHEATPCLQIFAPDSQEVQSTHRTSFLWFSFCPSPNSFFSPKLLQLSFLTGDEAIKGKQYKWEVWDLSKTA